MPNPFPPKNLSVLTIVIVSMVLGAFLWTQFGVGVWNQFNRPGGADSNAVDHSQPHHDDEHEDHVDISATAAKALGLTLERVRLQPFTRRIHLPARVVEKPGQSGLSITSPIQGVVKEIHRLPGQALEIGDLMFTLQVTDEALETAQLALLDILTRLSVTEREIERLDPLTETGAVVGRRKLEMEYQMKQLLSERSARLQELKLRGLAESQIQLIIDNRELINEIEVRLKLGIIPARPLESLHLGSVADHSTKPDDSLNEAEDTAPRKVSFPVESDDAPTSESQSMNRASPRPIYTVENLNVYPGMSVRKGEELCHIANHHELYVQGEAFPSDLATVRQALQSGSGVMVEIGEGESREQIDSLRITYMDNHADLQSHTFPFYLALPNQIVGEGRDAQGRQFLAWQFKPGQRAHVYVPAEVWPDQIVLPSDAVVRSGPEAFVFRIENLLIDETTSVEVAQRKLAELTFWELEPVPVQVLHRDRQFCVLAADQELQVNDIVVTNRAYQVYLAWKLQMSSGDDGHGHGHDH
jgi:multidrug efflux pump subunit AcrA (membrane-fusion protein)